jgi:protocadherin Fat 1/2/3
MLCVSGNIRTMAVLDLESKRHYWLTVFAQDHGVVPLHARLEVSEWQSL